MGLFYSEFAKSMGLYYYKQEYLCNLHDAITEECHSNENRSD